MPSLFRLAIASVASLFSYDILPHYTQYESPGLAQHCANVPPISQAEFEGRQNSLATTLLQLGASAYITESGVNSQYFANFSLSDWKLSERPLLLIIAPVQNESGALPEVTILTPKFEHLRATGLPVPPFRGTKVRYVDWAEDEDPYQVAIQAIGRQSDSRNETIFVDSGIRKFIVDGLQQAAPGIRIASAPPEITSFRERKSKHELEIMKCANEATVLAIRMVHKNVRFGMRESQVRGMLASALSEVGLKNGGCLTLFGANIPLEHRQLWDIVRDVQEAALQAAKAGNLTRHPDEVARHEFRLRNLDQYFTHRLGHGIGIDGHERPYLRGRSNDVIRTGHTFSNEPGVYIEGKVGIRLEDCFYIDESGLPVYFTAGVGGPPDSPWST
ncbi:peptidase M24 [Coprinopsis marcescibilis]|uniref:Peptidase M24 n=1 Tax=Coprinopsis marcescibilis TaxID=230819 RepID=A0A5C3L9T8_COPMA|nr:peptidase M24 [Coprinopsis marcescibilis]